MSKMGSYFVSSLLNEYQLAKGSVRLIAGSSAVYVDTTRASVSVVLAKCSECRDSYVFVYQESGANTCTISPASGDTVLDGSYSSYQPLTAVGDYVLLYCDGVVWYAVKVDITA